MDAFDAIATLLLLGYAALCGLAPLGPCRKCKGFGFYVRKTRLGRIKRGPDCRRCHGYGARVRVGRRIFNVLDRMYRDYDKAR